MTQRIKSFPLAQSIAFMGGVEQADEGLFLADLVLPTLELPRVPYPARSGRFPFYTGGTIGAIVGERGHVGIFCSSEEYICRVDRIDILNRTAVATETLLRREDNPITGVVVSEIVPLYIDAGQTITPVDKAVVSVTPAAAAIRGVDILGGAAVPTPANVITPVELTAFIQGGVLWAVNNNTNQVLSVAFSGEIIPVVQRQSVKP